jgi:hypothetical protein
MKTILFSAAALSFTGAALANGGEWSALDREVEALASSLVDTHDGIQISGYADIWYRNQADSKYAKPTRNENDDGGATYYTWDSADESGFGINNARLMLSGGSGGFGVFVEYQLAAGNDPTYDPTDGNAEVLDDPGTIDVDESVDFNEGDEEATGTDRDENQLLDAYVTQELGGMKLSIGRMKVVGNASAMEHERDMFFQTRSNIGYHFATRDEGVQLSGNSGFNWSIGIADGTDGNNDEYRMSLHADMDFGGGLTGGATLTSDGDSEGETLIIDLGYTMDAISVSAEMAQVGEDGGAFTGNGDGSVFGEASAAFEGDSSPWAVAATYALGGDSHIGIRLQDADTEAGDSSIDIAYHWQSWNIQYSTYDNDNDDAQEDMLIVGVQVGF